MSTSRRIRKKNVDRRSGVSTPAGVTWRFLTLLFLASSIHRGGEDADRGDGGVTVEAFLLPSTVTPVTGRGRASSSSSLSSSSSSSPPRCARWSRTRKNDDDNNRMMRRRNDDGGSHRRHRGRDGTTRLHSVAAAVPMEEKEQEKEKEREIDHRLSAPGGGDAGINAHYFRPEAMAAATERDDPLNAYIENRSVERDNDRRRRQNGVVETTIVTDNDDDDDDDDDYDVGSLSSGAGLIRGLFGRKRGAVADRDRRRRREVGASMAATVAVGSSPTTERRRRSDPSSGLVREVTTLEEYKRVVVQEPRSLVVVFWYGPWCKSCRRTAPLVQRLAREYSSSMPCRPTDSRGRGDDHDHDDDGREGPEGETFTTTTTTTKMTMPVKFVKVPVVRSTALLHQGLDVPSVPFGHIYHPTAGLVEELTLKRKQFGRFEHILRTYVGGYCDLPNEEQEEEEQQQEDDDEEAKGRMTDMGAPLEQEEEEAGLQSKSNQSGKLEKMM